MRVAYLTDIPLHMACGPVRVRREGSRSQLLKMAASRSSESVCGVEWRLKTRKGRVGRGTPYPRKLFIVGGIGAISRKMWMHKVRV